MPIEKSKLSAALEEHWRLLQGQKVEVPELALFGADPMVQFDPLTIEERDKLREYKSNEYSVELVIMKAKDADGNKLFTKADKPLLMFRTAPSIIARIASAVLMADEMDIERLGELLARRKDQTVS